jgi:uncharacterized protein
MKSLPLLLFCLFFVTANANPPDCKNLHEGIFRLTSEDSSTYLVVRTKVKQTEILGDTLITEFSIKWISDCRYALFNRHVIKGTDYLPPGIKIDTLFNEVTEVSGNEHKVVSKMKGYDMELSAVLNKISDKVELQIPKPQGFVNDFENILTDREEKQLDSIVQAIEKKTTIEIAIVTLNDLYTNSNDFDNYTLRLANEWGVGKKGKDNGIVIAFSKSLRSMRIQNGYSIEKKLTDSETQKIVDNIMIPQYKIGNFYQGTVDGIQAIMQYLK